MPTINLGKAKVRDKTVNKKYQQGFYQTPAWKRLRAAKRRANPLCEKCERNGRTRQMDEVHHKKPWETGSTPEIQWQLFTDYDNLESLCTTCHHEEELKLKKY
jgi:5-methylcytosine-specific restriction protein A